jgi:hypothetical protein
LFASDGFAPALLWIVPLLIVGGVWFAVAVLVNKGDDVDRPNRMAQLYGYTVCLISLVVGLLTISSILNAAIDRANPLQTDNPFGTSLSSFESYRATYRREQMVYDRTESPKPDTTSEASLRRRYDALVQDRIAATRYRTGKSLVIGLIFLVIAAVLFTTHWRWMRKLAHTTGAAA